MFLKTGSKSSLMNEFAPAVGTTVQVWLCGVENLGYTPANAIL